MAGWNDMSGAAKGGAGAAVTVVVAVVGWWLAQGGMGGQDPQAAGGQDPQAAALTSVAPETSATGTEAAPATAAPEPSEPAAAPQSAEAVAEPAAPAQTLAPTIDVLRVAPDGTTTLAGLAEPGAVISVQIDGAEVASVQADGAGQYATLFTLAPSTAARMLSLVARLADGTDLAGAEGVAIAPFAAPEAVQVAAADPAAEPAAPAAIIVTEDGAQVAQPAEPVPADLAAQVSLDVISYTAEGGVQLGGKGAAGAALALYLDNAPLAQTAAGADGIWSLTVPDIAPGLYTLRIDQIDAAGAVTSRLETPFKRETLEALAAASGAAADEPAAVAAAPETGTTTEAMAETAPAAPAETEAPAEAAPAPAEPTVLAQDVGTAQTLTETTPTETSTATPETAATETTAQATPEAAATPAISPVSVTVQPGFTLWAIAKENFGSGVMYVQVFDANRDKIKDPDLIYPGQVLLVPAAAP